MAQLVDDLLEVSRITHGRIVLRREPLLVGAAVYGALETLSSMASSRASTLPCAAPAHPGLAPRGPAAAVADSGHVLNNACKYTDPAATVRDRTRRRTLRHRHH